MSAALDGQKASNLLVTRGYQQEMLNTSIQKNIIIALDTGSGKTHIAVLRLKHEMEHEQIKHSWFIAPTVALCMQQYSVLKKHIPVSIGIISGANEPTQWKKKALWEHVLLTHRIMVSTPQVLLDALRHGYIVLGSDISLIVFDEAHHAVGDDPYNRIMQEFYFDLPPRHELDTSGRVRPMILGLTASPIFGGNVEKAFRTLEGNLDCTICAPRVHRSELSQYVFRPIFRHIMYNSPNNPFSTNLASLTAIVQSLDIEKDPYVVDLRKKLSKTTPGSPDYHRYDQRLSKLVHKEDSFTHKGLRDFERTAREICDDLGGWAADWFVWTVVERAKRAAKPSDNVMASWRQSEKAYLLSTLDKLSVIQVSYYPDDIADDCTDKVNVLIDCLLTEKAESESLNDVYSGIVFVQRRDTVLALAELLMHHPRLEGVSFNIGVLLGMSESAYRHSVMDITRNFVKESQEDTLADFKEGEKNLIISTAVAEEGLDIQACGSVIRWDPPQNMPSWAQSRGRARKQRSTFTILFEMESTQQEAINKWVEIERKMTDSIYHPERNIFLQENDISEECEDEDEDLTYEIPCTGAKLTLHSAISHLTHFCAVIPNSAHVDNRPLFERDPPEYPEGWHFLSNQSPPTYLGLYGSTVTLPRALPIPERQFTVDRLYKSVTSAHRHAAFKAYKELHTQGLLNDHLLPIATAIDPRLDEEVKLMLADVEKRDGLAEITTGIDPWAPDNNDESDTWLCSELTLEGLPPLLFFTRSDTVPLQFDHGPVLYRPGLPPTHTSLRPIERIFSHDARIARARDFTRRVFWGLNASRMDWDNLNFSYLFLPVLESEVWDHRRRWLDERSKSNPELYPCHLVVRATQFVKEFGYTEDLVFIQQHVGFGRPWRFTGWRYDALTSDEEKMMRRLYEKLRVKLVITYPLLTVESYPPRTNLLIPTPARKGGKKGESKALSQLFLIPEHTGIIFLSKEETEYSFLLPSVLRFLSSLMTANSLRNTLFEFSPLRDLPLLLLADAITAPSSNDRANYQRLETLGDAVLKFVVGIQLMAEYPLWHEGYLTRKKDHAVANVTLAKEDLDRRLYRWIIRDIMLGRKWKPKYFSNWNAFDSPPHKRSISDISLKSQVDPPSFLPTDPTNDATPTERENENANTPNSPITKHFLVGFSSSLTNSKINATSAEGGSGKVNSEGAMTFPKQEKKKKKLEINRLSTKVLADVVESVIGASYLHGGLALGYECAKYFNLGLRWETIPTRVGQILDRVDGLVQNRETPIVLPPQVEHVERMLAYTFNRKLLLVEALTHASYQNDENGTSSYERMEFLGDSILDLIVCDYLYHAAGKNYTPGHMHMRKSAVVNSHLLAYVCLNTSTKVDAYMPKPNPITRHIEQTKDEQEISLFQCLLQSSSRVMEDQVNAHTRYRRIKTQIEQALTEGDIFPWAALTKLQAPKFLSDMVESLIGAVFIDSQGSMEVVKGVIEQLGIMKILEYIVISDMDVLHPVSRLGHWTQKNDKEMKYDIRMEGGKVSCRVLVDGHELNGATITSAYRGKASQEEVKFAASEAAIKALKLRDVGVHYKLLKKRKTKPQKKKAKEDQPTTAARP